MSLKYSPRKRLEVFWERTVCPSEDACWLWTGCRNACGYGTLLVEGKCTLAHRWIFHATVLPVPPNLNVLHTCDNPACVNPKHLFLGTQRDNVEDCVKKGRCSHNTGIKNGNSRLSDANVKKMRCLSKRGVSTSHISRLFNIAWSTADSVLKNKTWKH